MSDRQTALYYDENAAGYVDATLDISMDEPLATFSHRLLPGARVLDLGCGSGRDLKGLNARGFRPTGLDVSESLAHYARRFSGCPVVVADMLQLPFADGSFAGAWASASILHIARQDMPQALGEIRRVLEKDGVLFSSLKLGSGDTRTPDSRYFTYVMPLEWHEMLLSAGFENTHIEYDKTPSPRTGEKWIRSLAS